MLRDKNLTKVVFNKNDWLILINTDKEDSVFDLNNSTNYTINLSDEFIYAKRWTTPDKILLKTKNWIYIYDIDTNTWIKNTIYNDYVLLWNDKILWIIYKADKEKFNILNFPENSKDKIILNDLETRDRKVVFETEKNIKYIEKIENKLILTTDDWKEFQINALNY